MKVAILVDEIAPGSAPKLVGWPIRKLKELGVEAEALVVIEKDHWRKNKELYDFHLKDVKVRYFFPEFPKWAQKLNFKFPGMSFFSLHHIVSLFFAHRLVKPEEFDIIIANCQYSAFAARNLKKRCGIPFLFLMWDPSTFTARKIYRDRFGWKYPLLYLAAKVLDKFALAECEAVITSGRFHHPYLKKITSKPIEILAPGCFVKDKLPDFSLRKPMILAYDRWDIGNVPNIFLDILTRLSREDIELVIAGFWHPQSLKEDFQKEASDRGLDKRIRLLGSLDESMIMELCSEAMLHLHPVHEAFGMQTLEAAACGCPIIIPAGSGVADLFEHGVHGYFPKTGSVDELIQYVDKIFIDKDKTKKMSEAAYLVARNYTWQGYAGKLEKICRRYINRRELEEEELKDDILDLKTLHKEEKPAVLFEKYLRKRGARKK